MATIKEVAKLAQVSTATVSNVITGKKYVSPELAIRINNAIKELNYSPSKIAQSLKVRSTNYIGLVVPDITNPYFAEVVRGVESVAIDQDYQIFLVNTDGSRKREEDAVSSLLEYHVAGLITVVPRLREDRFREILSIPTVIIDNLMEMSEPNFGFVYTNSRKVSAEVARHLMGGGYKRFACIAGPSDNVYAIESRVSGFVEEILEAGFDEKDVQVVYGKKYSMAAGYEKMKEILDGSEKPVAVFCCSDIMALGAMEACKEARCKIPEEVAIVGYDNVYFASLLDPPLSTVNQKKYDVGQIAITMLLEQIGQKTGKKEKPPKKIALDAELIVRKSS
ncbi:LacI family transcriptional regulator [Christensenellaceae bacterium OttesenSCG-928-K19]|nr:LacI family transcriptional regulator [Christensenellaceae bacterium OttesenSCG-928-K19]